MLVNVPPVLCLSPLRQVLWAGLLGWVAVDPVHVAGFQVAQARSRVASCKQGLEGNQRILGALS